MRNNRLIHIISKKSGVQTSLERKLARITHDPIRLENGEPAQHFPIKAVRLG